MYLLRKVHQTPTVVLEIGPGKGLGEDVDMLISRLHVLYADHSSPEQVANKMEPHVDVLAP